MLNKASFSVHLLGVLLPIILTNGVNAAPTHSNSQHSSSFQKIEQPLPVKVGVTIGGLGLIGLELWWFLLSKPKTKKATVKEETQELDILVDGGYAPNRITVQSGKRVRLNFLRKDPSHCLDQVLFPDFNIAKDLPLNQTTTVEFTPQKPGTYTFSCGMNMVRGVVEVQS